MGQIVGGTSTVTMDSPDATLTLSGANGYGGGTIVSFRTLQLGNSAALGTGGLTVNGGTLDLNGNSVTVPDFSGTGGTVTNNGGSDATLIVDQSDSTTFAGTIQDGTYAIALSLTGSGELALTGTNSYSGGTEIESGTLQLGSSSALGTGGLTVNGGTLDLGGYSVTVPSFSGTAGTVTNSGGSDATLTVDQAGNTVFSGTISDGATNKTALVLTGNGTLVLSGDNSFSGGTDIVDGTLDFANDALGSGAIVFGGGTLQWAPGNTQDISDQIPSGQSALLDLNGNSVRFDGFWNCDDVTIIDSAGNGNAQIDGGDICALTVDGGSVQFDNSCNIASLTFNSGNLTLNNTSEYCDITVNAGTIAIPYFSSVSALTVDTGATVEVYDSNIGAAIVNGGNLTVDEAWNSMGEVTVENDGTLTFTGPCYLPTLVASGGSLDLNGNSVSLGSLSGSNVTIIDSVGGGTAQIGNCDVGSLTIGGGTTQIGNDDVGSLTIDGGTAQIGNCDVGSLTVDGGTTQFTNGNISALTVIGGSLTLAAECGDFSIGSTNVAGGTLVVEFLYGGNWYAGNLGDTSVTGGTLDLEAPFMLSSFSQSGGQVTGPYALTASPISPIGSIEGRPPSPINLVSAITDANDPSNAYTFTVEPFTSSIVTSATVDSAGNLILDTCPMPPDRRTSISGRPTAQAYRSICPSRWRSTCLPRFPFRAPLRRAICRPTT